MNDETEDIGPLAERLNQLFEEIRSPTGKRYSLRQVADGVNAQAGHKLVSFQYLSLLRTGTRRNPRYSVIDALSHWFGVPTDYFSRYTELIQAAELSQASSQGGTGGPAGTTRCQHCIQRGYVPVNTSTVSQ